MCVWVCWFGSIAFNSYSNYNRFTKCIIQIYFIPGLCINLSAHIGWFVFFADKTLTQSICSFLLYVLFCVLFINENHHIAHEVAKWCSFTLSNKWENIFRLWLKSLGWWDFDSFLDAFFHWLIKFAIFFSFAIICMEECLTYLKHMEIYHNWAICCFL